MNLKTSLIIVLIMIAAGILFGGRIAPNNEPPTETSPTPTATAAALPASTHTATPHTHPQAPPEGHHEPEETPVPTPSYDGGEDPHWTPPDTERHHTIDTATLFVDGWLNPDPAQRTQLLKPVAAQALIDELAAPDIKTWNTTPTGTPQILELVSTNAMVRQRFTDGRAIDLLLAADPGTTTGWIVTDLAPTSN